MLGAQTRLLDPAERNVDALGLDLVDPDHAGFDPVGDRDSSLGVTPPDRTAQTPDRVVGALDDFIDIVVDQDRHDGAELLFLNDLAVFRRVIDDRDREEVTRLALVDLATQHDLLAVCLDVGQEGFQLVELHPVLDGTNADVGVEAIPDLDRSGIVHEGVHELGVDRAVNVEPLDADAPLTLVAKGPPEELWDDRLVIRIRQHDGSVVPAQLKRHALDRTGCCAQDVLAGFGRAGKADLGDIGVIGQLRAEGVTSRHHRKDAFGQHALGNFAVPQGRQRRERCRLQHEGVAGDQRRSNLPQREQHREVPGRDPTHHAERDVVQLDDVIGVVLDDLDGDTAFRDLANVGN